MIKEKMKTYIVKWEIDVEAKSPKMAAIYALLMQRDPDSMAVVYDVIETHKAAKGVKIKNRIDLLPLMPAINKGKFSLEE
jgi:hypothetical protein